MLGGPRRVKEDQILAPLNKASTALLHSRGIEQVRTDSPQAPALETTLS
jgi:hypothetical protein